MAVSIAEQKLTQAASDGSPVQQQQQQHLPRRASVSMRANSRGPSQVASQLLATAALPDSLIKGGFPKAISNRSALRLYDTPAVTLAGSARLHSSSRQGSALSQQKSAGLPPAFADLVPRPRQAAGQASLALRSGITLHSHTPLAQLSVQTCQAAQVPAAVCPF